MKTTKKQKWGCTKLHSITLYKQALFRKIQPPGAEVEGNADFPHKTEE